MSQFIPVAVSILHTNDLHGCLSSEKFALLASLRERCDLFFDTGDAIKTGNLGAPLRPEPVWSFLSQLRCDASVLGNRETHPLSAAFEAKLSGAGHPILCANLKRKDGSRPLPSHLVLNLNGTRIGLVGVMVAMVTSRMKTQFASAYLWDPPIETACAEAESLKGAVDVLFALTHIGHRQDILLAQSGVFDVIFGGHSHTTIASPEKIGKTWIVQGGSHGRYAGVYRWDGSLTGQLHALGPV